MLKNILKFSIYFSLNSIIAILIIDLILTFSYFKIGARSFKTDQLQCSMELTGYNYCPSILQFHFMDKRDKILPINNYISESRRATYKNINDFPVIKKKEKIYLIGDSFIQADELPIEERFEHLLRKDGFEVVAFGYSSWNSWQFERISQTLKINPGDRVFIFSMTNDYTPHYASSTVKTLNRFTDPKDEVANNKERSFGADYMNQSFFFNRVYPALLELRNFGNISDNNIENVYSIYPLKKPTCQSINDNKIKIASDQLLDYLMYSQKSSCWTQDLIDSANLNIALLNEVKIKLENKGAVVKVLMVPAGWAFENQNSIGRLADMYNIPNDVVVSHEGLIEYLKNNGLMVDDLTAPLARESFERDSLYFPVDGHWTKKAHKLLKNYISSNYLTGLSDVVDILCISIRCEVFLIFFSAN